MQFEAWEKDGTLKSFNPRPAVRPGDAPHLQPVDCFVA